MVECHGYYVPTLMCARYCEVGHALRYPGIWRHFDTFSVSSHAGQVPVSACPCSTIKKKLYLQLPGVSPSSGAPGSKNMQDGVSFSNFSTTLTAFFSSSTLEPEIMNSHLVMSRSDSVRIAGQVCMYVGTTSVSPLRTHSQ